MIISWWKPKTPNRDIPKTTFFSSKEESFLLEGVQIHLVRNLNTYLHFFVQHSELFIQSITLILKIDTITLIFILFLLENETIKGRVKDDMQVGKAFVVVTCTQTPK